MGLTVTKAHKLGGPAWEVRSPQPVSSHPHALCRTSAQRPLPGGPSLSPGTSALTSVPASFAGPPNVPGYLVLLPGGPLPSLCLLSPSALLCLFGGLLQALPTSSSWMHHHRAPFSPHLKWASRVIELKNATNRRGSSLRHSGQFVPVSAVLPRPVMLLRRAARIFLTFWFQPDVPQGRDVLVLGWALLRQQLYPSLPASLTISGGPTEPPVVPAVTWTGRYMHQSHNTHMVAGILLG